MLRITVLVLSLFSLNAYAGISAIVIAYGTGDVPVSGSIDIEAEYVAMSVSLSSDAKYPAERAKLIQSLQNSIKSAASKAEGIDFQQGAISLSPQEKSSFSISKSYGRSSGSSFYILSKLGEGKDVYSATQDIYTFISHIKTPEDTSLSLGNTSLAIISPNGYRTQLLEKIKAEIESAKKAIGSAYKVSISGLESPVVVRQKNDRQVTLFIDYRLQLSE
jgi:hypothetical protein